MIRACIVVAMLAMLLPGTVSARVTRLRIDSTTAFAAGASFGETGAYERVRGVLGGELEPADARNAGIAGLDRAPRNARGLVEYDADFVVLRPADPARGNHRLLFEVPNRGDMRLLPIFDRAAAPEEPGDSLLLRIGYTLAWVGWDPDVPSGPNRLAARLPALRAVTQEIREELVSGTRAAPVARFALQYAAAEPFRGSLAMRRRQADPRQLLSDQDWRFVDRRTIALASGPPEPGTLYDLTYTATDPWVSGIGLAAIRDGAAFLRSAQPANPARGIGGTIGFGAGQGGRFLRQLIDEGFNADEDGSRVFDGVFAHGAGIGRVFLNTLFAQPRRSRAQHEDHAMPENWPPFSALGLLHGNFLDPLLIETNSSADYWQKGASLLSTDADGRRDLDLPPSSRLYLIAGTGQAEFAATGACAAPVNRRDPQAVLRALLVAMERWITDGTPPPESAIPRVADRTLVAAADVHVPGLPARPAVNDVGVLNGVDGDWVHPMPAPSPYTVLVPAVDADGNEIAGIRLPDVSVPVATHTGWNYYAAPYPDGELCDGAGSSIPFAAGQGQRDPADPRASLAARYGTHAAFVARVQAAADQLEGLRLLLPDDAAAFVAQARAAAF